MAHSTSAVSAMAQFPAPSADLALSIGLVADRLISTLRESARGVGGTQRDLLEGALAAAAEAEQRIAEQSRRIEVLEALAMTDEVTGLANRRGFDRELHRALANARRYGETGILALTDLDDFKTVNDVYGHLAGDRVLRAMGQLLLNHVRENDFVARLGGDEFAILLPHSENDGGRRRIQAIGDALDHHFVDYGGVSIPVRASIGTTSYGGEEAADSLMRRADEAMYEAKRIRAVQNHQHAADKMLLNRFNSAAE
ncbi:MAG: GGDEF domain-containing protein [Alphaproteobacteria bacterium]|jgi:diguanylate cyclase (GGDEF)-like protein|nr:GGDEF domain-containing protein [Alphaproteobacteria bacterium]